MQVILSSDFRPHLLPDMHLLWRVSVPSPHVTEQVHDPHDDQATKKVLSDKVVKIFLKLRFFDQVSLTRILYCLFLLVFVNENKGYT